MVPDSSLRANDAETLRIALDPLGRPGESIIADVADVADWQATARIRPSRPRTSRREAPRHFSDREKLRILPRCEFVELTRTWPRILRLLGRQDIVHPRINHTTGIAEQVQHSVLR